jgi:shikimate kinase
MPALSRRLALLRAVDEESAEVSIEDDFSALSDDVERLAMECAPKLDGVSLFLVGMMGSGKSTVGQLLAKTLEYCFFDSDALIEQLANKKIPEIFSEDGEEAFREIETQVGWQQSLMLQRYTACTCSSFTMPPWASHVVSWLMSVCVMVGQVLGELSAYKTCVVATGGGAIVSQKNWSYLQNGVVVYMEGEAALLTKRVVSDGTDSRPMLEGSDDKYTETMERLNGLLEERSSKYERADIRVPLSGSGRDTECGAPPAVVVHRILTQLLAKLNEKIRLDDEAAKKEFSIEDKGPIPVTGPMPDPNAGN